MNKDLINSYDVSSSSSSSDLPDDDNADDNNESDTDNSDYYEDLPDLIDPDWSNNQDVDDFVFLPDFIFMEIDFYFGNLHRMINPIYNLVTDNVNYLLEAKESAAAA